MGEVDGKLARHLMGISWEFSMGRSYTARIDYLYNII